MSHVILTEGGFKSWPLQGWQPVSQTFHPQRRGIELIGLNNRAAYETLYRTQPWVHTVVNKIARGIARLPLETYSEGVAEPDDRSSSLPSLLRNPYPKGSAFSLKEAMVGSLALYANSLTIPDYGDAPTGTRDPVALWPIPWRYVYPLMGVDEPIGAYLIQIGTVRRLFLPEDVIHLQWWSPEGFLGISPLEPLRTTLALEDAAQRYSISSFAHGARPSGAVSTASPMAKGDREQLKADIEATYGGVDNAFRVALLTHGLKWEPMSHTAVESELINLRKLTREEVCSVYDLSPSMVHIQSQGGRQSTIVEEHRMLYQDTYAPWMSNVEEGLGIQLLQRHLGWAAKTLRFDVDEVLRGDEDQRSIAAQRRFQSATKTPNELRADEGLGPVMGSEGDPEHPANQVFVPVNMLPANRVLDSIELQPAPGELPGNPGPGGEHVPTAAEQRSMIRELQKWGYRIELETVEPVHANGSSSD